MRSAPPIGRLARHAGLAVGLSAAALLITGCTSASGGSGAGPSPSSAVDRKTGAPLDAAGIDPCALLDDAAQSSLGVTDHGPAEHADFAGATCRFVVDGRRRFDATATDGLTLEQFISTSKAQGRTTSSTSIGGYEAALSYSSAEPSTCTAAIGVSDTGMVVVTYEDTAAAAADESGVCGQAHDIGEQTLDGLIGQQ